MLSYELDGLFVLGARVGAFGEIVDAEKAGSPPGVDAFDTLGVKGLESVSCWWRCAGVGRLVASRDVRGCAKGGLT